MKPEGAKRIWGDLSGKKITFTEFYGDGDCESSLAVKETYKGTKLKKLDICRTCSKESGLLLT